MPKSRPDALPPFIPPQLAMAREELPEGPDWIHEVKFDGYRVLAFVEAGEARLLSRNTLDWSRRFAPVAEALAVLRVRDAIIDGEVCVLGPGGRSDPAALKALIEQGRPAPLSYLVFDLLWLDGEDLRTLPLLKRKARLEKIVPKRDARVQYVEHFVGDAVKFFVGVCEAGLEGTVSKRADAPYESGRTTTWIKVKCLDAKEFAVAGYLPSERGAHFKSLILGETAGKRLVYRGVVGSGFTAVLRAKIAGMLAPLETGETPLAKVPWELRGKARWVRPDYVVQVRFTEITRAGVLSHPRFLRIRHASEPGVAEHLRSRMIADRKPKRKRRAAAAAKPDPEALLQALRKSVGGEGKRARRAPRKRARG
jgi:bifunctional non-homologous end joining protein LigD